ncbi:flavodoxin FldB [Thalassotalea sp. PP2-459]|uniref:flavodoxin FldB n=1 Tax=Thalassotalea sp. PP2-459 TaxID=1742724 RepID=UPI0009452F54|nr:flavodoxin FldB [Thalassotalea sp. PP2-459]OKY26907.1 flavodoxin FldB [Thalassotalea sp. PP2-459]
MNIGLFYGSTTCYTEIAAEKIQAEFPEHSITLFNLKETSLSECLTFDILIFGISTWDYGEIQEDWESQWQDIALLDLNGKIIALYGMGDQIGYTDWFQDALGLLHDQVIAQGGYVIGQWPNSGYEFAASKALTENGEHFVGLALDEDNQYDLSDERIATWCQQITNEISEILQH